MLATLSKISVYLVIIALGYTLKRIGIFKKEDATLIGKIVINVTLPAALLSNRPVFALNLTLIVLTGLAIITNTVMLYVGYRLHPKKDPKTSAIMLSTSTYNLGTFLLPFLELVFPGSGILYMIDFDLGNAIMGLGVNYVAARYCSSPDETLSVKTVLKGLMRSTPLLTYIVLILLSLFSLNLPEYIYQVAGTIAGGNGFLSMLMVGLLVDFSLPKSDRQEIFKVTAVRVAGNALFALSCFLLPVEPLARVVAALCLSGPVATASVVFARDCGYKGDLVGMVSALSILISLPVIISLILLFG